MTAEVLVLGAGPAGAAAALGLARLGHQVELLQRARAFDACEGISERSVAALRTIGLAGAVASCEGPVAREASWNGETRAMNREYLLRRAHFDAALLTDLRQAGIRVREAEVAELCDEPESQVQVGLRGGARMRAGFVVDARGREARRAGVRGRRGPVSVALGCRWHAVPGTPAAQAFSFAEGWAWCARFADGDCYTQICLARDPGRMPPRARLERWLRERVLSLPLARSFLGAAAPAGGLVARAATSVLHTPPLRGRVLRVGDAAMAVDPLSGNGIFQALSSASVAPAVVNTLLREPASAALAERFYADRLLHLFDRFSRIGRDFYRMETRWRDEAFWRARRDWPDDEASHATVQPRLLGIARRAVLEQGFIRERDVALVSDQPLGVWRVAGVEIVPLIRDLPEDTLQREECLRERIDALAAGDGRCRDALSTWCAAYLRAPENTHNNA